MPGSRRWTRAPSDGKSRAPPAGMVNLSDMVSPYQWPLAAGRPAASGVKLSRQQPMEMIPRRLALDAEPPRVVRPALQPALHLLADAHVKREAAGYHFHRL